MVKGDQSTQVGRANLRVDPIRPAYEQVADQLRSLIVQGELAPGDQLPIESDLAATFSVSRSTIREALRSLASQNLVYSSRGVKGGTFVAQPRPSAVSSFLETSIGLLSGAELVGIDSLLETRELLEIHAVRMAAGRAAEEHLLGMREAIAREVAETERKARFEHHRTFHETLLRASGNELLEVLTQPIFQVLRSRYLRDDSPSSFWNEVDSDHEDILRHIQNRDADAAAEAMRAHLARLSAAYRRVEEERLAQDHG
ncbi:MAG: FCD domain-containing protein [Nocardiopsaceae bacterium]|nr:FCD domain-containing protein [Nocardiopsaceae bacterium]